MEVDSIFGKDEYLYTKYLDFNSQLTKDYKCKNPNFCGNEIIYKQLISGEVTKNIGKINIYLYI